MIQVVDSNKQGLVKKVYDANQEHVFRFWGELDEKQQNNLLAQLGEVDFDLITTLNRDLIHGKGENGFSGKLEPADFIHLPKTEEEKSEFAKAKAAGEEALRAGRVAAFLVAGGQGSRLGFEGPKGKYPISPVKNKTLFQLHAEKILASSKKYGVTIPWYIMTSQTNNAETEAFFIENDFFGLNSDDVIFFTQAMIPALDPEGKLLLDAKDNIFRNPNGHGGSLAALKDSGALADMRRRGIDLISYFQVDNVLIKICDPVFTGFHVLQEAEMSAKIVVKTDPAEKVGHVVYMDGTMGVVEYSDLSEEDQNARNADGSLKYQAGSIAIHIFDVGFVERETEGGLHLPWHLAHKKIPYLDENGELISPENPNAYKFETFVFDALGHAKNTVILEVERKEEFSPVKNAEGGDSPENMIKQVRFEAFNNIYIANPDQTRTKYNPKHKSHIFVAMPFSLKMDDIYHFGIKSAVNSSGFTCLRADKTVFTGCSILEWIKKTIETALFVIADLTDANQNVYFELGYAQGCNIPTILVIQDSQKPMFDVRGQRCLYYKNIMDLENLLRIELKYLAPLYCPEES